MKYIKNKKIVYSFIIIILIIGVVSVNYLYEPKEDINNSIAFVDDVDTTLNNTSDFYVDIKGSVKKPGVYKVNDQMIVQDVITMAGGLTKNAYTKNINLANKLKDGMVIYIFNKSEMTTKEIKTDTTCVTEVVNYDNCIIDNTNTTSTTTSESSSLININTATKDDLMKLTGIGESKAISIIEYRKVNKFNKIEDIMNVSGIGEAAFAKIKEYITV